jgi:hypothetical protein
MDHLDASSATVSAAGWTLRRAVVRARGSDSIVTAGPDDAEAATGARRGILAAVAHQADNLVEPAGDRTSLIALSGLVEGFYNARPTLGQAQALAHALNAINRWMFAFRGMDGTRPGLAVSLSAAIFSGNRAGLVQIGGGMILRLRAGEVARLTEPQLLRLADGRLSTRRALGTDSRVSLDYQEDTVLAGDRYMLISDGRGAALAGDTIDGRALTALCRAEQPALTLARALAVFLPDGAGPTQPHRTVIVLDVVALPEPTVASAEAMLADLPLAPVPQEGENRDGYRIGRTLHRGAYTLLKHAVDMRTKQPVVLKFPLPAMLHDRVFQAGFARETWVGTSIHSPVIARVIPPEPGRRSSLYIVMPYYRGETLEARLTREPRVSAADIVAITLQLCRAVEDLRAIQVLHRDLKPENVMLVTGGGLRLLDLGLAYLAGVEDMTANGLAGTIRYMAPELLRGSGPDDLTEVYALGAIMHRLAAFGRFPRPGADVAAALRRTRPDLPPALARIIAAALDADAAGRPKNAGVLAQQVAQALEGGGGTRLLPRHLLDPLTFWRALALALGLGLILALALR